MTHHACGCQLGFDESWLAILAGVKRVNSLTKDFISACKND